MTTYFLGFFMLWVGIKISFFLLYRKYSDCLYLNLFDYPIALIPLQRSLAIIIYQLFYAGLLVLCFWTINDLENHRRMVVLNYLHD